jgi:hypothetical protein
MDVRGAIDVVQVKVLSREMRRVLPCFGRQSKSRSYHLGEAGLHPTSVQRIYQSVTDPPDAHLVER